jgi:hypothetical protein
MLLSVNNFYTSQKRRDVTGCLNRLPKIAFNYFILSLPVIIVTITVITFIITHNIIIITNCGARVRGSILLLKIPWRREIIFPRTIDYLGTSSQKGSPALVYLKPKTLTDHWAVSIAI